MSEKKIRLQVPDVVPEGFPEFLSHGNFEATLTPGSTVETVHRGFADVLVRDYGLVEAVSGQHSAVSPDKDQRSKIEDQSDDQFPDDFPRRELFAGQEFSLETLRGFDRDQLIALPGIGEKTADAILEYFANDGGN